MRRRTFIALLALGAVAALGRDAAADEVPVPVPLQAELLVKVAGYDKSLAGRAGDRVRVLIVVKPGSADGARVGLQLEKALAAKDAIAGMAHERSTLATADAATVARTCRERRIAIVYFASGFRDDEAAAFAKALEGVDVLSAAAMPQWVQSGVVLGFDLISGKPKILFHLTQARKQNVKLSAEVLKMARLYE
jgi:hypothetical protein